MFKANKIALTLYVTFFLTFLLSPTLLAEERVIELKFEDHSFSAHIRGAPLRAVIRNIKGELQGVWFKIWLKKSKNSLDEKISVEFKDLPIRKGMKRIFSQTNHSLVFSRNRELLGVFLLGKHLRARGPYRAISAAPRVRIPRRRPVRHVRRKLK